ncbi:MAG: lactonase family protein [Thermomicrobiales bacterium]
MPRNLVFVGTYTDPSRQAGFEVTPSRPVMGMTGPTGAEGIYVYRRDPDTGALTHLHTVPGIVNPAFLALDPTERFLYAVNETLEFDGEPMGAVSAFAIDAATGLPRFLNRVPSGGGNPCHLTIAPSGRHLIVANHEDARVAVFPIGGDGSLSPLIDIHQDEPRDPGRRPHAHFVLVDPTGKFLLSSDTGTDRVMVYRLDAETGRLTPHTPPWGETHQGGNPRHLAFHPSGRYLYANGEADLTLSVFAYDAEHGTLTHRQHVSTIPDGTTGRLSTAQMQAHPNGRTVYVANRGHDSIAIMRVDQATGQVTRIANEPTRGSTPRYFAIDPEGRFLYVGNQNSGTIIPFQIDEETGLLDATDHVTNVPAPTCIAFTRG